MSGDEDPQEVEWQIKTRSQLHPSAELDLVLRPHLDNMEELDRQVSGFTEDQSLSEPLPHNIKVCLDELVSNAVCYAFHGGKTGTIRVRILRGDQAVHVEVSDDGSRFNPLEDGIPADLESTLAERQVGCLGITLVRALSDEVAYRYSGGRNIVSLTHLLST